MHFLLSGNYLTAAFASTSRGSTSYAAIRPKQFLAACIPLPPLDKQRRIVARIEALAGKIEAARALQSGINVDLAAMLNSAFNRLLTGAQRIKLGKIAPLVRRPIAVEPGRTYAELGVRSFGRGLFDKPILAGDNLTWQKLFQIQEGDLVFSNIKAWEGAFAVARQQHGGMVGSHRYLTCVTDTRQASADFIWFYLQSPEGLLKIQEASPGSADRNRTLSQNGLEAVTIPLPSLDAQHWFEHLQRKVESIRAVQTPAELDALLPSVLERAFRGGL